MVTAQVCGAHLHFFVPHIGGSEPRGRTFMLLTGSPRASSVCLPAHLVRSIAGWRTLCLARSFDNIGAMGTRSMWSTGYTGIMRDVRDSPQFDYL